MLTFYLVSVLISLLLVQASVYVNTQAGVKFTAANIIVAVIMAFLPVLNLVIIFKAFTTKEELK